MGNYVLSLQPTFTQGLILGQLSILALLALILKYLFLDSSQYPFETSSYHPRLDSETSARRHPCTQTDEPGDAEPAEWFNLILQHITDTYRSKLRSNAIGSEGDELARGRIETYANKLRPAGFLDHIKIHSVDLGNSAPRVCSARLRKSDGTPPEIEFDLVYTDSISVSLSTSYLFNYPLPSFARLPVSLTISLSVFKSSISVIPPSPTSLAPVLTISIPPTFTLDLNTSSLMGSRAKLANVPKLHELIQHHLRRTLAARGTWKFVLPGLASVAEAKELIEQERAIDEQP